ncbi:MAG: tRNA (adenosine(37)-N6)-threonylcarbamoyltransferase complex transferase subunit TsaD [Candidatus Doudnabacteria bacterium]|nr:tRNA (adenosine(37)-N6)-threonylcarbamoyltransferase complex transferase subunit TsaD [Candidatus Doudnabacteria bacterium]
MSKRALATILAIETSADETSAAVFSSESGRGGLSSNIIYSQLKIHRKTGGIVPEVAARVHIPKILPAIDLALKKAKTSLGQIDAIAVTAGPGLITSLMIGVDTAKALAFALNKPIIPINHLEGHLLSAFGRNTKYQILNTKYFPALGLIVSGGHTLLVLAKQIGRYKILGQTVDDAAGECFDKVAKLLGLPYPGGPAISKLAKKGNPNAFAFPRPMLNQQNFNFSFAGLKTAVLYFLHDLNSYPSLRFAEGEEAIPSPLRLLRRKAPRNDNIRADIAASVEQAIIDVLAAKTLRAAKEYSVKTVLLGGGVAANQKLRKTLAQRIKKETPHTKYLIPNTVLTTDNAGMIAIAGFYHYIYGHTTTYDKIKADPNMPLKSWR